MLEIRLAQGGEVEAQREIWRRCFGDPEPFIDFYFANRYREQDVLLLLEDGKAAAMLTMVPVQTITKDNQSLATTMLYGIATHPDQQGKGFASKLIRESEQFLQSKGQELTVLVPAQGSLFDYYGQRGYQEGFYIQEITLAREQIQGQSLSQAHPCTLEPLVATAYNRRRKRLLQGQLHIAYADREVDYQKRLSQLSGADIYGIDCGDIQGCVAVERISQDRVLIKELLLPEEGMNGALQTLAQYLPAREYHLRTPINVGGHWTGANRPFAMFKALGTSEITFTQQNQGYLGLAFD